MRMTKRASTFAKHHTPDSVRLLVRRAMLETKNARLRLTVPVAARCEYDNVYHCTVRKSASQWMKALLSDPIVYRYSGLVLFDRRVQKRSYPHAVPTGRVVSALFPSYERFKATPKPDNHRAFFVARDPRDIVVSSYYSLRTSHTPMGDIPQQRRALQQKSKKDGLLHIIGHLSETGLFSSLRSWALAPSSETIALFRYEDLTGERQRPEVERLMRHCGIAIPPDELTALLARYSFANLRGDQGGGGTVSHYRKGKAGDWRNHFDDEISEAFTSATGDLVEILGYPARGQSPAASPAAERTSTV
jgi:hypothetical protein